MGNPKGKSGGKGGKQAPETPKCMCEDPYRCSCGNRPERPSKGHKWDPETQQWGGKGHKQKGASGQTASKAVEATTTSVGKTTVAQWQRLPSELLNEVTKREGRPPAKYKQIGDYKFRVIVQDAKPARRGTDHDLIFVPAHACGNEEQAKEEAALLALLHMTPSIPHERKLPEPYKTTWVHAVKAAKNETKDGQSKGKAEDSLTVKMPATARSDESASGAQASTNLRLGNSFVSMADRKRQQQAKRQERNARIRKHEAVRMANRDHQVFLSAQMRRQIEKLLRGETVQWEEEDRDDMTIEDDDESDLKAYVLERLHSEGFTRVQARTSFAQLKSANQRSASEEQWDSIYEECLQWLCIHLDEDQLPEGFDPRGRTLDVIVARDATKLGNTQDDNINQTMTPLANKYGLSTVEASILIGKKNKDDDTSTEQLLWNALCARATTPLRTKAKSDTNTDENNEILLEELEALEAIFPPEECRIFRQNDFTTVVMSISSQDPNWKVDMEILLRNGIYPSCHAERLLLSGTWPVPLGATVHIKLIEFLGELPLVEPMIYEIYGKCRSLLQEAADGELTPVSLTLAPNGTKTSTREAQEVPQKASESSLDLSLVYTARQLRRPRERASFWSTPPNKTSPAISFPVCDSSIRRQRESLPAAKARTDFLEAMRRSNHTGRVVLITGDTGCGK
jgi:ATP-dependent RNA helicase DHX57